MMQESFNLLINTAALSAVRDSVDLVYRTTVCISAHALGRYFQRQTDRADAGLLRDLAIFSRTVVPSDPPEQDVRYATESGAWVGLITPCDLISHSQAERRMMAFNPDMAASMSFVGPFKVWDRFPGERGAVQRSCSQRLLPVLRVRQASARTAARAPASPGGASRGSTG